MGGWENKQIVGQKNTDEFFRLIQPHSFRRTKAEVVDLPPKVFIQRQYEMSEETRKHYKSLQNTFMTAFENGEIIDVPNAAVCALRLQQILCGYLPGEDGKLKEISNERIEEMLEIVRQIKGQIVIWARFNEDIRRIENALKKEFGNDCCKTYVGATKEKDRTIIRSQFNRGEFPYLISNPQAGGTGNDLPGNDRSAIYYSNSHRSLDRWQSEDRIHRIGTKGTVNIFDLVAAKSVDKGILASLSRKRDISSLTFDELRALILG
jgi:SNF2 family DNA or RNA helicase